MSWPICARVAPELRLCDPNLGEGGIARGLLGVDVRLGNEAASLQCDGAFIFGLGQCGLGLCSFDRGCELRGLFCLHRPVDDGEGLACLTQLPASTSTWVIRPPAPAIPIGWSRLAPRGPLAVITQATSAASRHDH